MHHPVRFFTMCTLLLLNSNTGSTESLFRSGDYEITARTILPNLAENLRYATLQEQRCLHETDLASVFPILRHESLQGCRLDNERHQNTDVYYQLICKSSQVANGVAKLELKADRINGVLDIQMGGKNMTFSQRIEALWQQDCAPE